MMVLTPSVAMLIGCVVILMWRRAVGLTKNAVALAKEAKARHEKVKFKVIDIVSFHVHFRWDILLMLCLFIE
ncbi:Hypothetical predicted protein [Olea europaea subsp. europaea]|uniref:Uncharacterized protein n=1 Tax=Olea europaea subsp. europaea TaxID=158383 RepID=A0A8S0V368_OLEEU|nr:Hypothetical predicted protein [Olea europaea subsp. europaea]